MPMVAPQIVSANASRDLAIPLAYFWCEHCGQKPLWRQDDYLRYTFCSDWYRLRKFFPGYLARAVYRILKFFRIGSHHIVTLTPDEWHERFGCRFVLANPKRSEAGSYCLICCELRPDDDHSLSCRFE